MKHDDEQAIALWRLGVLGPLTSARLEHGDRRRYIDEAAARTHERPDGRRIRLSARTIEIWYYAYRRGGFKALFPGDRKDRGQSRAISAEVAERILRVKRERPRRSIRRIIRMHERAGDLWAGDAKHGPPRTYYVDLGSAYIAGSLVLICAELGTRLLHTGVRDCEANAYAERSVRSIKYECLDRMIFFGERSLRKATREFAAHYHTERNHQGLDNRRIEPDGRNESTAGPIQCFQRLGGMLRFYRRLAA